MTDTRNPVGRVLKYDESLGLVLGYAIICTEDGEPYYDLQDDHIPEHEMLKGALDFMSNERVAGDMHVKDASGGAVQAGTVLFAWPMTSEIAKAYGLEVATTGLMIGVKPSDQLLEKVKTGERLGFSIGGLSGRREVGVG